MVTVPAVIDGSTTATVGSEARVWSVRPAACPVARTVISAPSWADVSVKVGAVAPAMATSPAYHCHETELVAGVHGGRVAVSVVPTTAAPEIVGTGVLVNVPLVVVKVQVSGEASGLPTRSVTPVTATV